MLAFILVPGTPPQNVTFVNSTAKSIFISWDVLPTNHTYGEIFSLRVAVPSPPLSPPPLHALQEILGHNVEYCAIVRSRFSQAERKINSVSSIHYRISCGKKYEIKVLAYDQCGNGPSIEVLLAKKISKVSNILNRFFRSFSIDF